MRVLWYGATEHRNAVAPEAEVITGVGLAAIDAQPDCIVVVEASCGPGRRSQRLGLRWLQQFRRDVRSRAPALVYSFESQARLQREFSMLSEGVPGSRFIPAPFTPEEWQQALRDIPPPLTDAELQQMVRSHCGVQEEALRFTHSINNRLAAGLRRPGNSAGGLTARAVKALVAEVLDFGAFLRRYGLADEATQILTVSGMLSSSSTLAEQDVQALLERMDAVERTFRPPDAHDGADRAATPDGAPEGYETIYVVDDEGYPQICRAYLEARGYGVLVETRYDNAWLTLSADPAAVLLCDQTLQNDPTAGRRLMTRARELGWRLIIALSGSVLNARDAPEADAICGGALAKTEDGARRVHQVICKWASEHPD